MTVDADAWALRLRTWQRHGGQSALARLVDRAVEARLDSPPPPEARILGLHIEGPRAARTVEVQDVHSIIRDIHWDWLGGGWLGLCDGRLLPASWAPDDAVGAVHLTLDGEDQLMPFVRIRLVAQEAPS